MMTLTAHLTLQINATYTPVTIPDLSNPTDRLTRTITKSFTDGTGVNQANRLWHDERVVNASANDDLDLAGVLVDVFGTTANLARVKALIIEHVSGTNELTVGNGGVNSFNDPFGDSDTNVITIRPGGMIAMIAPDATGYVVTAGTADILRIANGAGTSVTYRIYVVAANA